MLTKNKTALRSRRLLETSNSKMEFVIPDPVVALPALRLPRTKKKKEPLRIFGLISVTPGGNHAWYDTEIGRVRKPLGIVPQFSARAEVFSKEDYTAPAEVLPLPERWPLSLWERFIRFIQKIWRKNR